MREDRGASNFSSSREASCAAFSDVRHLRYALTQRFVKLPTVVILSFFMMYKSKRQLCVFSTCSLRRISLCNLLLFSPYIFSSFCSLKSCIAVSSSLAVGASRVPRKHCGQAHFSQVASSALLREASHKKERKKNWGCVIDSRWNRVPA